MGAHLTSELKAKALELPILTDQLLLAHAEKIAEGAKQLAPVGQSAEAGRLRDSIEARQYTLGTGRNIEHAAAVTAVFYWFFNEFGTVNQPPHPFMIPAFEMARLHLEQLAKEYYAAL